MVEVVEVAGRGGLRRFERVAEKLHGRDPAFVPPFPGGVVRLVGQDGVFCTQHGSIRCFVAVRDGRDVGRIAAIQNRTHQQRYGDSAGFFGFFNTEDEPATASQLLNRAAAHLRDQGCTTVRGPYNPTINDECGLLIDGDEHAPCIGMTWNPVYYRRLLETAGFKPMIRSYGFLLPLAELDTPPRLERLVERVRRRSDLRLRPIQMSNLTPELAIIRKVYNDTLERNTGFLPISEAELRASAAELRAIADPEMIMIAERNGIPAGVALSLPNINEILIGLKKVPHPLRLPWVLSRLRFCKIQSARQVIYGILPEFRDRGFHAWLLRQQFVEAKARYRWAALGWIEENNSEIIENSLMLGAIPRQTWAIYERSL